jgi:hypothetical protein
VPERVPLGVFRETSASENSAAWAETVSMRRRGRAARRWNIGAIFFDGFEIGGHPD